MGASTKRGAGWPVPRTGCTFGWTFNEQGGAVGIAPTMAELRKMPDEELVQHYDKAAGSTVLGLNFFREELSRRVTERQTRMMLRLTWVLAVMTGIVTAATLLNVWLVLRLAP